MELKLRRRSQVMDSCELLIVPYGIEIYMALLLNF